MADQQDRFRKSVTNRLLNLERQRQHTRATERQILGVAEKRMSGVDHDIGKLERRVMTDEDAADQYQELILERGRLQSIIAKAREFLS